MKKLDIALTAILCVIFIPLSIWGGLNRWAGAADFLPIILLVVAFIYSIIEGVRLKKPLIVAALCVLVTSSMFLPSLFFYSRDIVESFIVVCIFAILGFTVAIISSWSGWNKLSPSVKSRLIGILYFVAGISIFGVAWILPSGMPFGLLKWAFHLISIYLVIFVGIKKIIKTKGSEVGIAIDEAVPIKQDTEKFWKWVISIFLVFTLCGVGTAVMIGTKQDNQKVSTFKKEVQDMSKKVSPKILSLVSKIDPNYSERVPKELFNLMGRLARNDQFTYAFLYLSNPSDKNTLWRYQGELIASFFYKDCLEKKKRCNFKKISVRSNLERAIQKALRGNNADLNKINKITKASWQSIIVGKKGHPIAVLRLTIHGKGGDEQNIE